MSEVVLKDHSIEEPTTAHIHPIETIPQGTQSDGVLNGHDNHDVNVTAVFKSAGILMALIVFSLVVSGLVTMGILNSLSRGDTVPSATYTERAPLESAWPSPLLGAEIQPVEEAPQLVPAPAEPVVMLREEQEAQLHGSKWMNGHNWVVDGDGKRVVTIPIEEAMEKTLERGLPVQQRTNPRILPPTGEAVALGAIPRGKTKLRQFQADIKATGSVSPDSIADVEPAAH